MSEPRSDVLVLFGATGDLAHKKIFPALYSMVARGSRTEPIVGIAYDDWTVDKLVERAHDGIEAAVGKVDEKVFRKLAGLLRYSRLGRVALSIKPLNIHGMLGEILAAMKFQLDEVKAEVRVEPLPTCLGDAVQTSQVFGNLLDNALKYRHPGRPLRVTITGRLQDGAAIYSVEDNGIGIAPEHQAKVFEIFHRLNPDSTHGEGLGLTIAQRVLERQKGRIWVESRAGQGSTFHVSLPAVETHS